MTITLAFVVDNNASFFLPTTGVYLIAIKNKNKKITKEENIVLLKLILLCRSSACVRDCLFQKASKTIIGPSVAVGTSECLNVRALLSRLIIVLAVAIIISLLRCDNISLI